MKKIIALSTYFYPHNAGLELNMFHTYSHLVKKGWAVNVITTRNSPVKKNEFSSNENISGIKVERYPYLKFALAPLTAKIDFDHDGVIAIHDFITLPSIFVISYSYLLKLLGKKKFLLVLHSHGLFNLKPKKSQLMKMNLKRVIDRTLGVFLVNRACDGVRAVSQTEKKGLVSAGVNPELITVVYNGLEDMAFDSVDKNPEEPFKDKVDAFGEYVLCVARIDSVKNQESLIRSLPRINQYVKLILVGSSSSPDYERYLRSITQKLGLEDRVVFLGEIKGIDKFYLMRKAAVYAQLSRSEGFGNATHEAMSQGALCLVSKGTALEELISDGVNGFSVDPDDIESIASKITYILENRGHLSRMREKNLALTKDKSWTRTADTIADLYEGIFRNA